MTACRLAGLALATTFLTVTSSFALGQDKAFEGVEVEMTAEERQATGVSGLTVEQAKALNAWLRARFASSSSSATVNEGVEISATPVMAGEAATTAVAVESAREAEIKAEVERRVAEEMAEPRNAVEVAKRGESFTATLKPPFTGWSGGTVFTLENGHMWRQRSKNKKWVYTGSDLRVRFDTNLLGGWEMTVIDADKGVLVSPITN